MTKHELYQWSEVPLRQTRQFPWGLHLEALVKFAWEIVLLSLCACVLSHFSHVQHFVTLWTVTRQGLLSKGLSNVDRHTHLNKNFWVLNNLRMLKDAESKIFWEYFPYILFSIQTSLFAVSHTFMFVCACLWVFVHFISSTWNTFPFLFYQIFRSASTLPFETILNL